ncbi:MAG: hypothetical protein R3F11_17245 [Verrucomicrobiales bacterium]
MDTWLHHAEIIPEMRAFRGLIPERIRFLAAGSAMILSSGKSFRARQNVISSLANPKNSRLPSDLAAVGGRAAKEKRTAQAVRLSKRIEDNSAWANLS